MYCTFPGRDKSFLSELKNQLLSNFTGIVDENVLMLFDYNYMGVTAVRAVLLNANLEVAVSDVWTQYMKTTFVPTKSPLAETLCEEDDLLAKLKTDENSASSEIVELPTTKSEDSIV